MIRYGPRRGLVTKPPPGAARLDRSQPLARGLRGAWFFAEGGGATVRNAADPTADGTLSGATWATGLAGPALTFAAGTTQYVDLGNPAALRAGASFTLACRFKLTAAASFQEFICGKYLASNHVEYALGCGITFPGETGLMGGFYDGAWHTVSAAQPTVGVWYSAAVTFDGTTATIYVDGVQAGQTTPGGTVPVGDGFALGIRHDLADSIPAVMDYALIWPTRALSSDAVLQLARDPLGSLLWQPRVRLPTGTIAVQYLRPASDVATGTWTPVPASPTTLYTKLDEPTPDDTDYAYSATYPASDVMTVSLSSATDPVSSTGHVVRYRYRNNAGGGQGTLQIELLQGTTVLDTWSHTGVTSSTWVTASRTLSGAVADSISDYTSLRLRFTASVG